MSATRNRKELSQPNKEYLQQSIAIIILNVKTECFLRMIRNRANKSTLRTSLQLYMGDSKQQVKIGLGIGGLWSGQKRKSKMIFIPSQHDFPCRKSNGLYKKGTRIRKFNNVEGYKTNFKKLLYSYMPTTNSRKFKLKV